MSYQSPTTDAAIATTTIIATSLFFDYLASIQSAVLLHPALVLYRHYKSLLLKKMSLKKLVILCSVNTLN